MNELATRNLPELATEINDAHEQVRTYVYMGLEHALKCGELLLEAKAQLNHGDWLPWVKANCNFSDRTARAYMQVARKGPELSKLATVADLTFGKALRFLTEPKLIDELAGLDNHHRDLILRKAETEDLSNTQTRKIAESVAVTQDPAMREKLIKAPYSPYTHDPEMAKERAERYGAHDPMASTAEMRSQRAAEKRAAKAAKAPMDAAWMQTPQMSVFFASLKGARSTVQSVVSMDEIGKFSPEARPFIARKLRQLIKDCERAIERLEK